MSDLGWRWTNDRDPFMALVQPVNSGHRGLGQTDQTPTGVTPIQPSQTETHGNHERFTAHSADNFVLGIESRSRGPGSTSG